MVRILASFGSTVGESPVWIEEESEILWVDMPAGLIYLTGIGTLTTRVIAVDTHLGAVVPSVSGDFVAAVRDGFARISPTGELTPIHSFLPANHRMNDAKCDPGGRLLAGSLSFDFTHGEGALHVLTESLEHEVLLEGLTQPNGLGWSRDGRTFYLVDTAEGELSSFEYDVEGPRLSRRRLLRTFSPRTGHADGFTVDAAGCLWVAKWGGSRIERLSPDGDLIETIDVPVLRPTSCAFAGPNLDILVVTSAADGIGEEPIEHSGALLAIERRGNKGLRPVKFSG